MDFSAMGKIPQFLTNLKSQRIILIGNGPSAIDKKNGTTIDQFDTIIRINNYVTDGMEMYLGSRTDIWVNGANQGLKKRSNIPKNIFVMIPPSVLEQKGEAIHKRIQNRLRTEKYFMLPLPIMKDLELSSEIIRPTTGFFAIYFLYLFGCDITLHGFDFFQGSSSHYFDSPLKKWFKDKGIIRKAGKHDVNAEKTFIEGLIQNGEIKQLVNGK
ncbi:MAG: hypothetical protein HN913_00370 [Candidatus Marinimicrobia bacterium]|jgi:hypothetical protein|nr:hypothetical protein [Candidatus Neomarinimicrobiota bacterium]MBT4143659.1 hypothetical protein [Candidatus Neomarinimicrobiota bacterium]MBT4178172.1 hypothetical protein [Candidatus Neomarinimicrobiota bacterium]MBT6736926.1 hypothetical protein [Candidatus Neomarinimicrobiota bacterium]MBT6914859.1 hypothetical protein [Candidatus Neomarinimicrobiota bacterium]